MDSLSNLSFINYLWYVCLLGVGWGGAWGGVGLGWSTTGQYDLFAKLTLSTESILNICLLYCCTLLYINSIAICV